MPFYFSLIGYLILVYKLNSMDRNNQNDNRQPREDRNLMITALKEMVDKDLLPMINQQIAARFGQRPIETFHEAGWVQNLIKDHRWIMHLGEIRARSLQNANILLDEEIEMNEWQFIKVLSERLQNLALNTPDMIIGAFPTDPIDHNSVIELTINKINYEFRLPFIITAESIPDITSSSCHDAFVNILAKNIVCCEIIRENLRPDDPEYRIKQLIENKELNFYSMLFTNNRDISFQRMATVAQILTSPSFIQAFNDLEMLRIPIAQINNVRQELPFNIDPKLPIVLLYKENKIHNSTESLILDERPSTISQMSSRRRSWRAASFLMMSTSIASFNPLPNDNVLDPQTFERAISNLEVSINRLEMSINRLERAIKCVILIQLVGIALQVGTIAIMFNKTK